MRAARAAGGREDVFVRRDVSGHVAWLCGGERAEASGPGAKDGREGPGVVEEGGERK